MVTALANGANSVIPVLTIDEVFAKAALINGAIKAGEREALKPEGFDAGNSPLEFNPEVVSGKTVILTTTNGTKALLKSARASRVYIGSFLNLKAVSEKITEDKEDITIVCAGTNGRFSLDDAICAGAIIANVCKLKSCKLSDIALLLRDTYEKEKHLSDALENCAHVKVLKSKGFYADLDYCLKENTHNVVPEWNGVEISL